MMNLFFSFFFPCIRIETKTHIGYISFSLTIIYKRHFHNHTKTHLLGTIQMHLATPMVAALVTNLKLFMTPINEI